jgi:hypothetical protein
VILEKQKVLELADRHKIAVVGLEKPPADEPLSIPHAHPR